MFKSKSKSKSGKALGLEGKEERKEENHEEREGLNNVSVGYFLCQEYTSIPHPVPLCHTALFVFFMAFSV